MYVNNDSRMNSKWIEWGTRFGGRFGVFGVTAFLTLVTIAVSTFVAEIAFYFFGAPEQTAVRLLPILMPLLIAPGMLFVAVVTLRNMRDVHRELNKTYEQFRDFADIASDWFWETDGADTYTFISGKHMEITGISDAEILGLTRDKYLSFFKDSDRHSRPDWPQVSALIAQRKPYSQFRYSITKNDGRNIVIETSAKPVFGLAGEFIGYRGIGRDVTKEDLGRRYLTDAIEAFSTGFAMFDSDDRLILFNSHYRDMVENVAPGSLVLGRTFEELLTEWVASDAYNLAQDKRVEFIRARLARHRNAPSQREHQLIDGRWVLVSEYKTSEGGTTLVQTDITHTRRIETLLHEAVESLSEGFALYDENDRLVLFNQRYRDLYAKGQSAIRLGRTYEQILREAISLGQFEGAVGRVDEYVAERLSQHLNPPTRYDQSLPDGRWLRILEFPTPSGGVGGLRLDVTEEKIALQKVVDSEKKLAAMVEIAPEGVISLDANLNIVLFNRGAERIFGHQASQIVGHSLNTLIPTRFHAAHGDYVDAFNASDEEMLLMNQRTAIFGVRENGEEFPAEISVSKSLISGQQMFTVMLHDITDRKENERQMVLARETAEMANRTKSEFLANMSHELRTPLNAVIGFSEILEREMLGSLNAPQKERIGDIRDAGFHLLDLINDILDLSKIEAGKLEPKMDAIEVAGAIDGAVRLIADRARDAGIGISSALSPEASLLLADERLLKQMLINLLSNAVKFTPAGGSVGIFASLSNDGGVMIEVRDTGIGIEAENVARVTLAFWQAEGPMTKQHDGTGLGLPLVKSFMELHDGNIEIESEYGVGTIVRLVFPPSRTVANH